MHEPINVKSPNNTSKWQIGFNSAFKGLIFCVAWSCLSLVPLFLAGERTDVVLTADQPVANYWLHVNTAEDCDSSTIEGAAILRYDGAPENSEPFAPKPSDVEQVSHSLTVSCCLCL
jgi:hypothetical protein